MDPNIVKVVQDFDGHALYFSRAPIPWVRDTGDRVAAKHWKHIGLYGYRRDTLLEFPTLPPGELERIEQLEQLRWLENGFHMHVVETMYDAVSVDVPADIQKVEKLLQSRARILHPIHKLSFAAQACPRQVGKPVCALRFSLRPLLLCGNCL